MADRKLNDHLNPSTSAKPILTKLQILSINIVDMGIFLMTLKFSSFTGLTNVIFSVDFT